jgi:hypothetical protein
LPLRRSRKSLSLSRSMWIKFSVTFKACIRHSVITSIDLNRQTTQKILAPITRIALAALTVVVVPSVK